MHGRLVTAMLLALAIGLTSACTESPAPAPPSSGSGALPSPAAYATGALDLIGSNLFVDANWPAVREVARQRVDAAATTKDTYPALRDALSAAGQSPGDLVSTETMAAVPPSTAEPTTTSAEGITTVTLPGFVDLTARPGSGQPTSAEKSYARRGSAVIANATALTTCGWIVDVRGNSSTDVPVLVGTVGPLLPAGTTLVELDRAGQGIRLALDDGSVMVDGRQVLPVDPVRRSTSPVVVLQDTGTTRAGEAVVLAFRGRDRTTSIGAPTFGEATDAATELLPDGAHLVVTRWRMADRGGVPVKGPILPGQLVEDAAAQVSAARAWLRDQCR